MSDQNEIPDYQPARLAYLRPCIAKRYPAEVYLVYEDTHYCMALSRDQLMNMLALGTDLLRSFDKRPVEESELE